MRALPTIRCLLHALPLALATLKAGAVTSVWSNVTGNWSTAGNWSPAGVPPSAVDTVLNFGGIEAAGYVTTNDLPGGAFVLNALTLENIGGATETVMGNALRFGGLGAQIAQNRSGAFAIAMPLAVEVPLTLGGTGVGNVTLNGAVSGGGAISKSGASTFRFGTPTPGTPSLNTFYGGITFNGGTVSFSDDAYSGRTALRSNPIAFVSGGVLNCNSELCTGELSGGAGGVFARDAATGVGQNILITALGNALYAGGLTNSASAGTIAGTLTVRGSGIQVLGGSLSMNGDLIVGHDAMAALSRNATLGTSTAGAVVLQGGSFVLDNTVANNTNRLRNGGGGSTGLDVAGGGSFVLIGHTSGTTETLGRLQLGTATQTRTGAISIGVVHRAGEVAPTVLNIANYMRDSASAPRSTVDFSATNTVGAALALGQSGNSPRIVLTGIPFLFNNLLSRSNTSADSSVGWATVNGGGSFATHGGNGISAAGTVSFTGSPTPTANALLSTSANISSPLPVSLNSLTIAPTTSGQSLSVANTGSLSTNGILLRGDTDFAIVNTGGGTGGLAGPGGSRYIHVQNAALTVDVSLAGGASTATNSVTKAGIGTLILTNPVNATLLKPLTINSGTVRATPGLSLPGGRVELRGGVVEITGGGAYNPTLGTANANINWRGDESGTLAVPGLAKEDKGSGGFSAAGANASVDINGAGASTLAWEQPYFIDGSHALIFGSTRADRRVTFIDNINLNSAAGAPAYHAREICVIDNANSSTDFARISGVLSSSVYSDLLKTGDGTLELTGLNALNGGVIIAEGTLLTNNGAGLGTATDAYVLLGVRSGVASTRLLASNGAAAITIPRSISVLSGSSGLAVLGNAIAPDSASAGNAIFSGTILLGSSGENSDRLLQLTAEAGTAVTFSGAIGDAPGYGGVTSLQKTGGGTVIFSGANTFPGSLGVLAGTLRAGATNTLPSTSRIAVSPGATLALNNFAQTVTSISGTGNIDLGAGTLTLFEGAFSGSMIGTGGLAKKGTGTLLLNSAAAFTGTTSIEGGTLTGTGVLAGPVAILHGATLAPGATVGTMTTGSATFAPGGAYQWQINHGNGTQGGASGTDWHNINGVLTISAVPGDPFVLDVTGLTAVNVPGVVPFFNNAANSSWVVATASGGIVGFDQSKILINTANFADNNDLWVGGFLLAVIGNDLVLQFLSTPPTFEVWQSVRFSGAELLNPSVTGIHADADRDGWINLLEYAFNGDPHRSSAKQAPVGAAQGGYPTLTYTRRKNACDLTYEVEVSSDLMNWDSSPGATVETLIVDQGALELVTVRTLTTLSAEPNQFLRLKITWTPCPSDTGEEQLP